MTQQYLDHTLLNECSNGQVASACMSRPQEEQEPTHEAEVRKKVGQAITSGQTHSALTLVEQEFPGVLSQVGGIAPLYICCQCFVDKVRCASHELSNRYCLRSELAAIWPLAFLYVLFLFVIHPNMTAELHLPDIRRFAFHLVCAAYRPCTCHTHIVNNPASSHG